MNAALSRARRLRQAETEAERIAWKILRNRQQKGYKFRRQQPIDEFIVDCCFELRLIIELDGSFHSQPSRRSRDEARDRHLRAQGFRVLHFPNGLLLRSPEEFVQKMQTIIAALHPHPLPLPRKEGGESK